MKLWLIGGAAIAFVAFQAWSHTAAYRYGRSVEQASFVARINRENTNAGNAAEKWRGDLRRCLDDGGLFDFETGACQH